MLRPLLLLTVLGAASPAIAGPFWDRNPRLGLGLGLDLVVNLGPLDGRKRFGVAAAGWAERAWFDSPYRSPMPVGLQSSPTIRGEAQMGWTPPHGFSNVAVQLGGLMAQPYDGGYQTLGGVYGGAGLGIGTDGSAGPMLLATGMVPWFAGRVDTTRVDGSWDQPRLSVGPNVALNCCNTLY